MPYSSRAVANYFLDLATDAEKPLTPMKLQKLIYFAHGWHLAIRHEPLVKEEVEAWKFGPVLPSLYHDLKKFGNGHITGKLKGWKVDPECGVRRTIPTIGNASDPDGKSRALIKRVWDIYSKYSAVQLSNLTHKSGTPWDQVAKQFDGDLPRGKDIDADVIKNYFVALAKKKG